MDRHHKQCIDKKHKPMPNLHNIKASEFVKRQIRTSEFTYFDGTWEELEELTTLYFKLGHIQPGYRNGVILINVPPDKFFTPVTKIDDNIEFEMVFEARREGERPFLKRVAYGKKTPATRAFVVLYRWDVLSEDKTHQLAGSYWEIISLNASPYEEDTPMTPMAMARNQLVDTELGVGGTKGNYTPEEFAKAIIFWGEHVMVRER